MMPVALRMAALLIAVLCLVDPALETSRPRRVPVRFDIVPTAAFEGRARGEALRARLADDLRGAIDVTGAKPPETIVVVGDTPPEALPSERVPISTVSLTAGVSPNVRIARIDAPAPAALRQSIAIDAELEAIGMRGTTSVLTVTDRGTVVGRVEHRWSTDRERHRARLTYAPPVAGLHVVTVSVQPLEAERTAADNVADVPLVVEERPLRVLAFEPRPSWNATFVRRALEADARFEVESLVRSSRGVSVRSRNAPPGLVGDALHEFDVVIVGAPEEVRSPELDALFGFAGERGGGVVFLPDRRPSGPYSSRLPAGGFDETLVETPVRLASAPGDVRASELLVARGTSAAVSTLAAIDRSGDRAPVSVSWAHGAGRMVFWGALDAWRFRADEGDGFARFWQGTLADLAVAAPPRVAVSAVPRIAAVNDRIVVRATLRPTEFGRTRGQIDLPPVSAALVSERGDVQAVRLWPTAEVGAFEGHARPSGPGNYDVVVTAGSHSGRATLNVKNHPPRIAERDAEGLRLIAESTGGVHVDAGDLAPLERHLRGLAGAPERTTRHPMRSLWWFLPIVAGLSGEWALRRRRGLK